MFTVTSKQLKKYYSIFQFLKFRTKHSPLSYEFMWLEPIKMTENGIKEGEEENTSGLLLKALESNRIDALRAILSQIGEQKFFKFDFLVNDLLVSTSEVKLDTRWLSTAHFLLIVKRKVLNGSKDLEQAQSKNNSGSPIHLVLSP